MNWTYENVVQQVSEILSPQHIAKVLPAQVDQTKDGIATLRYATNHEALPNQIERVSGKTILFPDRHDWSTEVIIAAYHSQSEIEATFRTMNDWDYLRCPGMFHWTAPKLRVHALLEKLSQIYEMVLVYPSSHPPAPPRLATTLSAMDATQKSLAQALSLSRWRSEEG